MKIFRGIVITVLVLSLGLPAMTASAAGASMLLNSSIPNPVLVGGEVTFDLVFSVDGISPGVAGAEVYLSYNPAFVAPPETPGLSVAEVLPDFFGVANFSINEVLPAVQCPGGAGPCVHLVVAGPAQTSQTGIAARFHFRANVATPAGAPTCFAILPSRMVDANGFSVNFGTPATPLCMPIQGRQTTGMVLRQGVPANPNPGGGTLACASVTATGTWPYGPIDTDQNGNFNFANLPTGTYTLRAVYPGYLTAEKVGVVIPNNSLTMTIPTVNLRGGDVNGDNVVNILDIGAIISKFGKTGVLVRSSNPAVPPNCGSDEAADINDDGTVNISDLAIAAGNWGLKGPTNWP
jgi:hypothetical protein